MEFFSTNIGRKSIMKLQLLGNLYKYHIIKGYISGVIKKTLIDIHINIRKGI